MIATLLALALAANAAAPATLSWGKPLGQGLASLPRLTSPATPQTTKINAALSRGDTRARAAAADCRDSAKEGLNKDAGDWSRTVEATFVGVEFLSIVTHDDWYCGGPYPDTATLALTYDLSTGAPVNWARLLPPSLAAKTTLDAVGDGTQVGLLATPAVMRVYAKSALKALDPSLRKDCQGAYDQGVPVMAWLEAKTASLMLETVAFPHAMKACAATVAVPLAEIARLGAAPRLLDALKAAHAAHGWTDAPARR